MTTEQFVVVAVEDELSEAVLRKLLNNSTRRFVVDRVFPARGFGQLKAKIGQFRNASKAVPHIVLTDLDRHPCALALLGDWGAYDLPKEMLFRIAVRTVEAWLLADRESIAEFLGVAAAKIPRIPESERDPKQTLINLARHSRRKRLVDELVPAVGSRAPIGPLYNARMTEFVNNNWDLERAASCATSLARTVARIETFLL